MDSMDYSVCEHQHRFACWTAARAAHRGVKGLTVSNIQEWIESPQLDALRNCSGNPKALPEPEDFDDWHREICNKLISKTEGTQVCDKIKFGRAAKIVGIYLKTSVINPSTANKPAVKAIHPPIDRQLINALASRETEERVRRIWRGHNRAWSEYSDKEYADTIVKIVSTLGKGTALWKIEKYWPKLRSKNNHQPCPPS